MTYANKILTAWWDKGLTTLKAIFDNDKYYDANNYTLKPKVSDGKPLLPGWLTETLAK